VREPAVVHGDSPLIEGDAIKPGSAGQFSGSFSRPRKNSENGWPLGAGVHHLHGDTNDAGRQRQRL